MAAPATALAPPASGPARPKLALTPSSLAPASAPRALRRPTPRKASGIGKIITASTPNLRGAYSADPYKFAPAAAPPAPSLQRKGSHAALSLTSSSLAALPDASESYALATLNSSPPRPNNRMAPSPLTPRPGASFASELAVGDTVEVPGNMLGMVRFVGTVQGKKGIFTGVELLPDYAARGKNNGDVDGFVAPSFLLAFNRPRTSSQVHARLHTRLTHVLFANHFARLQNLLLHHQHPRRRHLPPPQQSHQTRVSGKLHHELLSPYPTLRSPRPQDRLPKLYQPHSICPTYSPVQQGPWPKARIQSPRKAIETIACPARVTNAQAADHPWRTTKLGSTCEEQHVSLRQPYTAQVLPEPPRAPDPPRRPGQRTLAPSGSQLQQHGSAQHLRTIW